MSRKPFRTLIVPMLFVAFAIAFVLLVSGVAGWYYLDAPSLIVVPILPFAMVCALFGPAAVRRAFALPFDENAGKEELERSVDFFKTLGRVCLMFGVIGACIGIVAMLRNISDRTKIGPNLALALLVFLYAAVVNVLIVLPFSTDAEGRLREKR